jgi:hypothetical protein
MTYLHPLVHSEMWGDAGFPWIPVVVTIGLIIVVVLAGLWGRRQ